MCTSCSMSVVLILLLLPWIEHILEHLNIVSKQGRLSAVASHGGMHWHVLQPFPPILDNSQDLALRRICATGGDDNDDAASSDDGMYIGNGGKNSSLRGIELHLIADVLQQVGLTIAGSILWYDTSTCEQFLSR